MRGSFYLLIVFSLGCRRVGGISKRFVPFEDEGEPTHSLPEERSADQRTFAELNSLFRPRVSSSIRPTLRLETLVPSAAPLPPLTDGRPGAFPDSAVHRTGSTQSTPHAVSLAAEDHGRETPRSVTASSPQITTVQATASTNLSSGQPISTGTVSTATSSALDTAVTSHSPTTKAAEEGLSGLAGSPMRRAALGNSTMSAIGITQATSTMATSSMLVNVTFRPSLGPTTNTASASSGAPSITALGASTIPTTTVTTSPEPELKTTRQPVATSTSGMALGENLEHSAPHQTKPMVSAESTLPVSQPTASTTGFPESELAATRQPEPTFMISTGGNLGHPAPPRPPVVVSTMPALPVPSLPPQRLPTPPQPVPTEPAPFFRPTEPAQTVVPAVPSQQPTQPPLPVVPTEPQVPPQPVLVPKEPAKTHPVVPPHVVMNGYIRTIIQHDADDYGPFVPHKTIEELVVDEDDHLKQGSCGKCQRKLHYCVQKCFTQHSCEAETVLSCPRIDAPCFAPFEKEHDQCQVAADCEGVHHLCCLVGCSRKCVPGLLFPIGAHP
ncbi:unnamed protein product [Ixodes pacificus]